MRIHKNSESGVSLMELLVVVAIIGLMLLVATPNFFTYYRTNQLRTSLRQFNTDVRAARQRAVTQNMRVRVTFSTGASNRDYAIMQWNTATNQWNQVAQRSLHPIVTFLSSTFEDTEGSDGRPDIVFRSNGTIHPYPVNAQVVLRANADIPNKQWTISFAEPGSLASTAN